MTQPGLDPAFWRGRRVLLTGHTGFKGAWAALWLHRLGADVTGLALPPAEPSLYVAARLDRLIPSHLVDLRDAAAVAGAVADARPQLVLHMAAQPLVRRAVADPVESFAVNVLGTVHLLQALRAAPELAAVLVVTSDKVYSNGEDGRAHTEADRLGGKDPYSGSKAACEIVTASMAQSYFAPRGVAVATARGGNVIGGGDFAPDRLVPDAVRAARQGMPLTLRHPEATRPWQHVLDCLAGYLAFLAALADGCDVPSALNFGPRANHAMTVGRLATTMLTALNAAQGWNHAPDLGSKEMRSLAVDSTLARRSLGWSDQLTAEHCVAWTADWYRAWFRGDDIRSLTLRQIENYEARACTQNIAACAAPS